MSIVRRLRLLLVPLTVALALAGAAWAAAAPPTPASGTFAATNVVFNSARDAGGNTIFDVTATVAWTGTFSGTSTAHDTLVFHPEGNVDFHGVETFKGTVAGVPGTVTFAHAGGSPPTTGNGVPFQETQVVVGATGALAGLHGVISEVGTVPAAAAGPVGTYSGQIQFGSP